MKRIWLLTSRHLIFAGHFVYSHDLCVSSNGDSKEKVGCDYHTLYTILQFFRSHHSYKNVNYLFCFQAICKMVGGKFSSGRMSELKMIDFMVD